MKNLIQKKKNSGFTIIEVMIVLAIAGLIMVIVFLAVPALQRNQRDNARQSIVNRLSAELTTYAGNNQGTYPFGTTAHPPSSGSGSWSDFFNRYISGKVNIKDPSTGNDVFTANAGGNCVGTGNAVCPFNAGSITPPTVTGAAEVVYGAKCNGESYQASGSPNVTARTFAILIGLDRAGTVYCVDNG